jgi:hypothetical protein
VWTDLDWNSYRVRQRTWHHLGVLTAGFFTRNSFIPLMPGRMIVLGCL